MDRNHIRVLLVEDDKFDQMAFKRLLETQKLPYDYKIAVSVAESKNILESKRFDVIICDYSLGDGTLFDILSLTSDIPVIVTTGAGDQDIAVKAMKEGAYDYLIKDFERNYLEVLPLTVENAVKHKRAEERSRMLSHAAKCINDSIYITDMNDKIIFVNRTFCKTYGYTEDEILGKASSELWDKASLNKDVENILSAIDEYGWRKELYHRRKDGSEFPISLSRSIIRDENGNEVAVVGVAHDMTERRRIEQTLKKAKEEAEAGAHVKTEFLDNMSRKIRTPLNATIGITELLLETELTAEQLDYLNVLQPSSDAMLSVINNFLDFSKIEAGQIELEDIPFSLRSTVEPVADIFSMSAEAKGLELMCSIDPDVPNWLRGDPTRLRQILINLVDNAVKFTEQGQITIKVQRQDNKNANNNDNRASLRFTVSDTGIGIPKEKQAIIFEKFDQADSSTSREYGDVGLGLNISESLLQLMNGRLWLDSREGQGSSVHFDLQLKLDTQEPTPTEYTYPDFKNVGILVVDDNQSNLFILQKILSTWGFKVWQATNGLDALDLLERKTAETDLVIIEHEMPRMDGIELAQKIRSAPNSQTLKIIMLSSWGGINSQVKQELNLACTLTKPIKQSKLLEVLTQELRTEVADNEQTFDPYCEVAAIERPGKIMLVDNNVDHQNLVGTILERAGYQVDIMNSGHLAIQAAEKTDYDLILMDVHMPVMNGFAATQKIRAIEQGLQKQRVPIVALSAHALEGYREKCLLHDMDDYIAKPFKREELLEAVAEWMQPRPEVVVVEEQKQWPDRTRKKSSKL